VDGEYVYIRSWNNEYYPNQEYWLGEDVPLCIRYADYDHETDNFKVEMYIYGPWCYYPDGTFCYTDGDNAWAQMTWFWTDGDVSGIDLNGDGVVEFAWGDCVQNPEWHLPIPPSY
jgi:hypothetical protein